VMISHERLDRLLGQLLPRRLAQAAADMANRRTAANYDAVVCTTAFAREEFDRIDACNAVTVPLGVDSGAAADNDPHAIANAVTSIIGRPERLRRNDARRRAEEFPWPRSAAGMLSALGAP
jgi:hypothetical protein